MKGDRLVPQDGGHGPETNAVTSARLSVSVPTTRPLSMSRGRKPFAELMPVGGCFRAQAPETSPWW
jgi:hypothetical protein